MRLSSEARLKPSQGYSTRSSGSFGRVWLPLAVLVGAMSCGSSRAAVVVLQQGSYGYAGAADAWLDEGDRNDNYGGDTGLHIGYSSSDNGFNEDHAIIRFALPSLTYSAVSSALLELYYYDESSFSADNALGIKPYRVSASKSWYENVGIALNGQGVSFRYTDQGETVEWTYQEGGWYDKIDDGNGSNRIKRTGGAPPPPEAIPPLNWVGFDVRPSVLEWHAGQPNNGLLLLSSSFEGSGSIVTGFFYSREYTGNTGLRPRLTLTYQGAHIAWNGTQNSTWDTSARNWNVGGYVGSFGAGDIVTFPEGAGNPTIAVAGGGVAPAGTTVSCSSTAYSFSGGSIGGSGGLTKSGTGTATLGAANGYGGTTAVNGGTLVVIANNALGAAGAGTAVANNAALRLQGSVGYATAEPLSIAGNGPDANGALYAPDGANSFAGPVTLAGASSIGVAGSSSLTLSGGIGGGYALTKTRAGRLTLSGNNTLSGNTTINAGNLALAGSSALGNSPMITLAANAVLDVTGRTGGEMTLAASQTLTGAGTVTGKLNVLGSLAPGSSVGVLTTGDETWAGGGDYQCEISDLGQPVGTGSDLLTVNGDLTISATAVDPFAIGLISLNGSVPGPAAGFDPDVGFSRAIATVSGVLRGFSADRFTIDTTRFQNDLMGGVFSVASGSLLLGFAPNRSPVALDADFYRRSNTNLKIKISGLLQDSTSDADGDARDLVWFSPASEQKVLIRRMGDYLLYETGLNDTDRFQYRVRDARYYRPGDTVRTATATIAIRMVDDNAPSLNIVDFQVIDGKPHITFAGIPRFRYEVQRTTDLTGNPTQWKSLATIEFPAQGVYTHIDTDPPDEEAWYRTMEIW